LGLEDDDAWMRLKDHIRRNKKRAGESDLVALLEASREIRRKQ